MTVNLNDLVVRQAAILAEMEQMHIGVLEFFANAPLAEDAVSGEDKARRLLRGLIRSRNVGKGALSIYSPSTDKPGIVPALPGLFVIDLLRLPGGGFDRKHVMKTPVVAWKIDRGGYVDPLVPGLPITDRWAVLTPDGLVITDPFTNLAGDLPVALEGWIRSEIEWLEARESEQTDFVTVFQKVFQFGGPLAKAIWLMMADCHDWLGTPEEMLDALSKFRDDASIKGWPSESASLTRALKELEPILEDAGIRVYWVDDGRARVAWEGPV